MSINVLGMLICDDDDNEEENGCSDEIGDEKNRNKVRVIIMKVEKARRNYNAINIREKRASDAVLKVQKS